MGTPTETPIISPEKSTHPWLKQLNVSFIPGPMNRLLEEVFGNLEKYFAYFGHQVDPTPTDATDIIFTTAKFGDPMPWREALIFNTRRRFGLTRTPALVTLLQVTRGDFNTALDKFKIPLQKEQPDPDDYAYPGLAPNAYRVLHEQGRRGGAILSLERLVQAQSKCLRNILVVGDEFPETAYIFDLVGAHPSTDATEESIFYGDLVLRLVTTMSTYEITEHEVVEPPIEKDLWEKLATPPMMVASAKELGRRNFFTDMVVISDLVSVPAVTEAVSSQYSEGCFVTWEPKLDALLTTITGSARPVDKGNISEDDLAVIVGVRPDGMGAKVRRVKGKDNSPPSSEAVEMRGMDYGLPEITLAPEWGVSNKVPVIRSKLHGHRGIASYNPDLVEFIPLPIEFYNYPVSCATETQATGIIKTFARSATLNNPDDPRQVAFTVLPGHGVVIAEKWVYGKAPFEVMWNLMDNQDLQVDNYIPQGFFSYQPGSDGLYHIDTR
jgi:hypothetical protein